MKSVIKNKIMKKEEFMEHLENINLKRIQK
jgi:hypothetical protein